MFGTLLLHVRDGRNAKGGRAKEVVVDFHVGPYVYRLVISDRSIFDAEGNELEGVAVEARRLLILSRIVEPERREEVAFHELMHAWEFHVPRPCTDEERCQFAAFVSKQFHADLEAAGGCEALMQIAPQRVPHLGRPTPATQTAVARETLTSDRIPCATCDADVMVGSIHSGEPALHGTTGRVRVERWMQCEACGSVQVWTEYCAPDGTPLGEFSATPPPQVLRGREASRWMADRIELEHA